MNLGDISYPELSLLRELVKAKQLDIWKKEWAPYFRERSVEEIEKSFQEIMGKEMTITDRGCCAMLLHRFEEAEKEIRTLLLLTNIK